MPRGNGPTGDHRGWWTRGERSGVAACGTRSSSRALRDASRAHDSRAQDRPVGRAGLQQFLKIECAGLGLVAAERGTAAVRVAAPASGRCGSSAGRGGARRRPRSLCPGCYLDARATSARRDKARRVLRDSRRRQTHVAAACGWVSRVVVPSRSAVEPSCSGAVLSAESSGPDRHGPSDLGRFGAAASGAHGFREPRLLRRHQPDRRCGNP